MILLFQNLALILGCLTIIIAGWQDKQTRTAPAIYLSPMLIGFYINPLIGLFGLILTLVLIKFWSEEHNKYFGLADILLGLTLIFGLLKPFSFTIIIIALLVSLIDLIFFNKENKVPLVWIISKWLSLVLSITGLVMVIG